MPHFTVSSRGLNTLELEASNWLVALGQGLETYGRLDAIERLACENLGNGTVIARDIQSGAGFIVSRSAAPRPEPAPPSKTRMRTAIDAIREAEDLRSACQLALELAQEFVPGESGCVLLVEGEYLKFAAATGPKSEQILGARIPSDTGVAGVCIQQGRPLVLGKADNDPRHFSAVDKHTGYATREIACVPVALDGHTYGVLEILNLPSDERFGRVYIESMRAVADLLAVRLAAGD